MPFLQHPHLCSPGEDAAALPAGLGRALSAHRPRGTMEAATKQMFAAHDLDYSLDGASVTASSADEATIAFSLTTRRLAGGAFKNNRLTGTWTMRKDKGQWKIYGQTISDIKYLD